MKLLIGGTLFLLSQLFIWNIAPDNLNLILRGIGEIMLIISLFLIINSKELINTNIKKSKVKE